MRAYQRPLDRLLSALIYFAPTIGTTTVRENAMKELKKTGEFTIFEKKSGRYAVKNAERKIVSAEEKQKILLEAGLIKLSEPKAVAPAEEAPAEEAAAEDAPAEDAAAE
jgi:hypothetical protein